MSPPIEPKGLPNCQSAVWINVIDNYLYLRFLLAGSVKLITTWYLIFIAGCAPQNTAPSASHPTCPRSAHT